MELLGAPMHGLDRNKVASHIQVSLNGSDSFSTSKQKWKDKLEKANLIQKKPRAKKGRGKSKQTSESDTVMVSLR
jgi:hypothetical protein